MILRGPDSRTYLTLLSLRSFAEYYGRSELLIEKSAEEAVKLAYPSWKAQTQEEEDFFQYQVKMGRYFHDTVMIESFRYSSIVFLGILVEREAQRLMESLEKEQGGNPPKLRKKGRNGFWKMVKEFCCSQHLDVSRCDHYHSVCDLIKVRDCIVHCRGDWEASSDRAYLLSLKEKRPGFSAFEGIELRIGRECIEQFVSEMEMFFRSIFAMKKWPIDEDVLDPLTSPLG
jgi:hypothetical protein